MHRLLFILLTIFFSRSVLSSSLQQLESEIGEHKFSQAAQTGIAILLQQPDNIQAKFLTALALQNNNQSDMAINYYQEIIHSHPELPEPRNNLAMIYMNKGQYDQAIDLLVASLKTHPAYATAWQNLNLLYQGLASEAYRKALSKERNPRSVMDKIQLTALTSIYDNSSLAALPETQTSSTDKPPTRSIKQQTIPPPLQKPVKVTLEELTSPLLEWASAWSRKDFNRYINAYVSTYKGDRANHQAWVNYRRSRIVKPGSIRVNLSDFRIKSQTQTRATIDFKQSFKSSTYADKIIKRIHLKQINGSWKITRESTIAVL